MASREIAGVRVRLANPDQIRALSHGEVKKPETINYRTLRPERDGLFCERIFGPTKSYECACGKYKKSGPKFKGVVCDRCGVEVTDNRVRRERMGHIELAAPVVHIWYLRGIPSRLSLLLGTPTKMLEKVIYFAPVRKREAAYKVVIEGRRPDLAQKDDIISETEVRVHSHYDPKFRAEEAFRILSTEDIPLAEGDVIAESQVLRYRAGYGEELFSVEEAWMVMNSSDRERAAPGSIVTLEQAEKLRAQGVVLEIDRAKSGSQDGFVVTSVTRLPFSKGSVLSASEYALFSKKYPDRFTAQPEVVVVEDPCYLVIEGGDSPFTEADIVLDREQRLCRGYDKKFKAGIGAEGVKEILRALDIPHLEQELREELSETTGQKRRKIVKRLQVVEDFRKGDCSPESMVLDVLPVIPPDLRPMVQLDGGRFATSDLNDLYRRVINRNNRLSKLKELRAPEIIVRNEKRMLQESVDALIDNGRMGKAVLGAGNRPLKSLTDLLRGKKGRFRQNLLGKRVDYSGRSVIAIGPFLKLYQCGLPKQMALELFKPFVIQRMVEEGLATNVKHGKRLIERGNEAIWGILEDIIKDHPVMLNRAPTLHRLGIQAFEPILMEGKAIRLHPMACTAFNADFDGDQMAVHVPLSIEAQTEARLLMLSANNLLSPASGKPIVLPTQDILLGIYHITNMLEGMDGEGMYFNDIDDVMTAMDHGVAHVNAKVYLRWDPQWSDLFPEGTSDQCFADSNRTWLITTPGRALFNLHLPKELRYVNIQMGKKDLGTMLDAAFDRVNHNDLVEMLDSIKNLGYHWAGVSGLSFQMQAIVIPPEKKEVVDRSLSVDDEIRDEYEMGILTEDEYLRQKEALWSEAAREIGDAIMDHMSPHNPIRMMVDSGARGSRGQLAQMAGIRGLMADPTGRIIDYPITTNFREGMNMLEYFISTHGARKGLADTALRTAKSGYLTRRLVDVAQDVIVMEEDCGTHKGIRIEPMTSDGKVVIPLSERIAGRTSLEDVTDPQTGELIVAENELIDRAAAQRIEDTGRGYVWVRSPLSCEAPYGICQKCYGIDLATRRMVNIGEAVGVVAAQSIGEPGTQLTMRTFHTGGVRISGEDITQGLPRIEQLFEVRRPKKVAILSGVDGKVAEIRELEGKRKVILEGTVPESGQEQKVTYSIPASQNLLVEEGQEISADTLLTDGYLDPQQLLEVQGQEAVQKYLVDSIQEVYRSQGVSINNKHIEVILRKVAPINRLRVIDEGDTSLVAGDLVWTANVEREVAELERENQRSLDEATRNLSGKVFIGAQGTVKSLNVAEVKDTVADAALIQSLMEPGQAVTELFFSDDEGPLKVIVGEASFRKEMKGYELVEPFEKKGKSLAAGEELSLAQLSVITSCEPQPLLFRDVERLRKLIDVSYLAADVLGPEGLIARADQPVTAEVVEAIRSSAVGSIKIWKTVEQLEIADALQEKLINRIWGKALRMVIDSDGEAQANSSKIVDGSIVRGLVDGTLQGVAFEDEEDSHLTREGALQEVLADRAYGKILLEPVVNSHGEVLVKAGTEIKNPQIDLMVQADVKSLALRPVFAQSETLNLISRVSFVRKLRVGPVCRKFIHGITKAALATESFLSAASFQQTAQILAGAAVRSQVDHLMGLKENVIIGHLIPAGTGIERFQGITVTEKTSLHLDGLASEEDAEENPSEEPQEGLSELQPQDPAEGLESSDGQGQEQGGAASVGELPEGSLETPELSEEEDQ